MRVLHAHEREGDEGPFCGRPRFGTPVVLTAGMNNSRLKTVIAAFALAALAACSTTGKSTYFGGGPGGGVTHSTDVSAAVNTKAAAPKAAPKTVDVVKRSGSTFASPRPNHSNTSWN